MWEELSYDEVAAALGVPVGTVRSRLNRARRRLRELTGASGEGQVERPDRIEPDDPADPAVFSRAKEQFMSTIDHAREQPAALATPDVYPRLAYGDELAAVD